MLGRVTNEQYELFICVAVLRSLNPPVNQLMYLFQALKNKSQFFAIQIDSIRCITSNVISNYYSVRFLGFPLQYSHRQ